MYSYLLRVRPNRSVTADSMPSLRAVMIRLVNIANGTEANRRRGAVARGRLHWQPNRPLAEKLWTVARRKRSFAFYHTKGCS